MKFVRKQFLGLAFAAGFALLAFSASGGARAALFEDDEARRAILELRQKIESNKQDADQKYGSESKRSSEEVTQFRRSLIELQNQLESLKAEIARLTGQNEQLSRDVAEMQRKQKDGSQTLEDRLRKLEPSRVTMDGREFLAEPAEKRDFEAGLAVFRKGDFANAQVVFVDFINRYPNSGYRPTALFWLGNAQYATKDYKDALVNFRNLVAQNQDHIRVPEAMLAIANCQLEIKDTRGARKTLEDLVAKHPTSEAGAAAKERLSRFK
jgi:tol-pal system protein YbgF